MAFTEEFIKRVKELYRGEDEKNINEQLSLLLSELVVRRESMRKVEQKLVARYGSEKIKNLGTTVVLDELISEVEDLESRSDTDEKKETEVIYPVPVIDPTAVTDWIEKNADLFREKILGLSSRPLEGAERVVSMCRIVVVLDEFGQSQPAIVTRAHGTKMVSVHVFPHGVASYYKTSIAHELPTAREDDSREYTWHWPNEA